MKLIHAHPALATSAVLLLASLASSRLAPDAPRGDALAYRSVAERTLQKRFVQHSELELVEMKLSIEGPDDPEAPEMGKPDLTIVDDETIEFSDETLAAGDSRPAKLKRSFTSIVNSAEYKSGDADAEDSTLTNESGLAGKSVLFTWDEEAEAFAASWFEDEGDDALLEPMVEDADFRAWLPGKEVEDGDTWTIPASEFNNLQEPSGPMGYHPEGAEAETDGDPTSAELRDTIKGEIKATYKGTRDEDGVRVGVIAFEGKLSSISEHDIEQEDGPSAHESTELSSELQGELLWDLAGGHFLSLSCDAVMKLETNGTQSFEIEEATYSVKEGRIFEGKKTYRFSCTVPQK